jgi:2-amino-4-hydroxy-6-hydroxymethyldihydropteridine diphosphokinase
MVTAYLALGSNLATRFGDPAQNLAQALLAIGAMPQTKLVAASSVHITKPDNALGDDFANSVCKIETELNAYELLHALQHIEIDFGRPAPDSPSRNLQGLEGTNGLKPARTLDLDILLYGDASIQSPALTVPHLRMHERAFVMEPLLELNHGFPPSRE